MLPPNKKKKKPSSAKKYKQDSLAEDILEIFDPTGISSYDDVARSYKENGLFSWQTGLEVLGALPIIGKVGKGLKTVNTASKYLKALNKVNKTVAKAEKVLPTVLKHGTEFGKAVQKVSKGGKANPVALSSIGVGESAKALQKLTKFTEKVTAKGVQKVIAKAPAKKEAITTVAATLNTANTLSDVGGAVQNQKEKTTQKEQGKPRIVYYNTNSKHGKVEKPGNEEGVQYVPVSNSVQLEKWKAQNNMPVTSNLKTKVVREFLGTVMPDQAAQFLSAIATKDNKLGIQDLTPDIQEALIESVKNAQKRTGKNSGGTEYIDYSPEVEQAFQGMSAGKKQMVSTDPKIQAATMLGRVSYKKNALGEIEIYDSYDFSKTNPEKATTLYKKIRNYAGEALPDDGKQPNLIGKIPAEELAYGTNNQGIMKNKMNPRKKYAQGTGAKGMDPNHYIISPAEALNDYNIMLAKAEAEANSNPWLPIVAIAGQAMQTGISVAGQAAMKKAEAGGGDDSDPDKAAMGMNNVQKDVEVEGGEMYETPQGQVGEFKGPAHEQGGIPLEVGQDVQEGTKVYSDRLKVGNKTLAERKATRERQIANLEKIASNNLADAAVKNAAKRKMSVIQKEEANDLAFQDQVNNMQAMADTMIKAFGTGMSGIQKMDNGGTVYGKGYNEEMFKPYIDAYMLSTPNTPFNLGDFQKTLGIDSKTAGYGKVAGPTTFKLAQERYGATEEIPNFTDDTKVWDKSAFANAEPIVNPMDAVIETQPEETSNLNVEEALAGDAIAKNTFKTPGSSSKVAENVIPSVGDMTKLIGNYLGMTSGIKTAAEQRSTDVTHTNVFANAGEESQRLLDNAKQGIETSKAQAVVKASDVGRAGKRGARGSARGVNQMRAMDWLYDTALQGQIAEISANAAQQISGIDTQKSSVAMSADQLKGQGEYQANMANEAAKDAYYTALGLGRKDFATGLQQTGKDLNDMKQNKVVANLLGQYGQWFKANSDGTLANKNTTSKTATGVNSTDLMKKLKTVLSEEELKSLNLV